MTAREVEDLRVTPKVLEVGRDHGPAAEAVLVELHRVHGLRQVVDQERDQAHVEAPQQGRHLLVGPVSQEPHVGQRLEERNIDVEASSRQHEGRLRESQGDFLEKRDIHPGGDRPEVAEDRAGDVLEQSARSEAGVVVRQVHATLNEQGFPRRFSPSGGQPLRGDDRDVRRFHEGGLRRSHRRPHPRERGPVVHAVVEDEPAETPAQPLGERRPEGKMHEADRAGDFLRLRQRDQGLLEPLQVLLCELRVVDSRPREGVRDDFRDVLRQGAQPPGLLMRGRKAGQRKIEDTVAMPAELDGDLLGPLETELPRDDRENDDVIRTDRPGAERFRRVRRVQEDSMIVRSRGDSSSGRRTRTPSSPGPGGLRRPSDDAMMDDPCPCPRVSPVTSASLRRRCITSSATRPRS